MLSTSRDFRFQPACCATGLESTDGSFLRFHGSIWKSRRKSSEPAAFLICGPAGCSTSCFNCVDNICRYAGTVERRTTLDANIHFDRCQYIQIICTFYCYCAHTQKQARALHLHASVNTHTCKHRSACVL